MRLLSILIFFIFVGNESVFAYLENSSLDRFAGKDSMNGYKYSKFIGFEKKWKLVTVRYRVDTGELRFTYANDLAWKTLMSGQSEYPDGAIFGKIGYMTDVDPSFTSSKIPSGARRFQFMVRNKKLHVNQNGWGYVLFDGKGKTFPEDPDLKIGACAACHQLVPDKGYVFSEPMDPSEAILAMRAKYKETNGLRFTFEVVQTKTLTDKIKLLLPDNKEIYILNGPLRKNIFQGTLDEIVPTLMKQAEDTKMPAALASEDFSRFTLVKFVKGICANGNGFEIAQTELTNTEEKSIKVGKRIFCN